MKCSRSTTAELADWPAAGWLVDLFVSKNSRLLQLGDGRAGMSLPAPFDGAQPLGGGVGGLAGEGDLRRGYIYIELCCSTFLSRYDSGFNCVDHQGF
jgi:hypothetical protein